MFLDGRDRARDEKEDPSIVQAKNVQVFKLITRGTIEERIDAIIRRKAAWTAVLVPDDPEGGLKPFPRAKFR